MRALDSWSLDDLLDDLCSLAAEAGAEDSTWDAPEYADEMTMLREEIRRRMCGDTP